MDVSAYAHTMLPLCQPQSELEATVSSAIKSLSDRNCSQLYCWGGLGAVMLFGEPANAFQLLPAVFYLLQHVVPSEAVSFEDRPPQPVKSLTRTDSYLIAMLAVSLLAEAFLRGWEASRKTSFLFSSPC